MLSNASKAATSAIALSREDVDRLLRDDSPDSRGSVLEKVAQHYNANTLGEREQEIAEYIFRVLMKDISLKVRTSLSERMKDNPAAPRDVMLHLANDVEAVAVPVLRDSKALSDADLVSIVDGTRDLNKLIAISSRETVSERVSGALVETNYTPVLSTLLKNEGAQVSATDLTRIATDFAQDENVFAALTRYPNLPITVVERLIRRASDDVAEELKQKYNLVPAQVNEDAVKVRDEMMLRLLEGDLSELEMEALVNQMRENGSLTPSVMMTALCRGQRIFFIMAMARLADVPLANAVKLIEDPGVHGFNGIYGKSGLPESMMEATRIIVRAVEELKDDSAILGSMLYANRLSERVVNMVGDRDIEYVPYFLALIRQNAHRK